MSSFDQPKAKTKWVQFLSEFWYLNRELKYKPYHITKFIKILFKLKDCNYDMSLDLNMGYYHILLSEYASNRCKIILPWRNNATEEYLRGLANAYILREDIHEIL